MRRPFTTAEAREHGLTKDALKWAVRRGTLQRIHRGVYIKGAEPVHPMEAALAILVLSGGIAARSLAASLYGLDGVQLSTPSVACPSQMRVNRAELEVRVIAPERVAQVRGYRCTDGTQTMLDLAAVVDDVVWEQALESAVRLGITGIAAIESELPRLGARRTPGVSRIRRVLALRPPNAPATGSILETMAIQLIRSDTALPTPERQVEVRNQWGDFVAFVDLAFPRHNVFLELDGGQHDLQARYDATRQTAVVAAKRWMPARFTWDDIHRQPRTTLRRLRQLLLDPVSPQR